LSAVPPPVRSPFYPDIQWLQTQDGEIKKENYDACDSLVCVLAYININRHGIGKPAIVQSTITHVDTQTIIEYIVSMWDTEYEKRLILENISEEK
jgi:hypothetical protein